MTILKFTIAITCYHAWNFQLSSSIRPLNCSSAAGLKINIFYWLKKRIRGYLDPSLPAFTHGLHYMCTCENKCCPLWTAPLFFFLVFCLGFSNYITAPSKQQSRGRQKSSRRFRVAQHLFESRTSRVCWATRIGAMMPLFQSTVGEAYGRKSEDDQTRCGFQLESNVTLKTKIFTLSQETTRGVRKLRAC